MIIACPFCNIQAAPGATNCASCGKRMSRPCPSCAETIAANATVCKYCGEESALPRDAAPTPAVEFIEEPARRCDGRSALGIALFWMILLALAGFCAYSMSRGHQARVAKPVPVEQQIQAPVRDF